jgi:hypothetical protein
MYRLIFLLLAVCPGLASAQLPDDSQKYHLIVITADQPTRNCERLLAWLDSDAELQRLKAACHFHHFRPSDVLYRERYESSLPATKLPIFAVARADGGVIYKSTGEMMPWTPNGLMYEVRRTFAAVKEQCPDCQPQPKQPNEPPPPYQPERPWLRPVPDSADLLPSGSIITGGLWIVGGLVVLGLLACIFVGEVVVLSIIYRALK